MEIDELIASYDPIDFKFAEIDKQESKSFIPSEKECREIFCIDAIKKAEDRISQSIQKTCESIKPTG